MRAGKLRHQVILQTMSRSSDGGGGASLTWADTETIWADINALSGEERYAAQKDTPVLSHEIIIRYRTINPQQRIKFGSRLFDIEAVKNKDERNAMLTLECVEQVGQT